MSTALSPAPPFHQIDGNTAAGVLFVCDHASAHLPEAYGTLGLPPAQLSRHIAYDIGAAEVTQHLAAQFAAPAVLSQFSRLLIDPNRGADDPTLVMQVSDGAIIPGNAGVSPAEIATRRARFWQPYRDAIGQTLTQMAAAGPLPAIVSLHSFTPIWKGMPRPWEIAVLWDRDPRLALPLIATLRAAGHTVGDNEPYDGALEGDTLHALGTTQGRAHVLIEVRQDLIATPEGAKHWASILAGPLAKALAQPNIHATQFYGSRAGAHRFAPQEPRHVP